MSRKSEVEIFRTGSRAFLRVGSESVEVNDYNISSSMRGGIELEVKISLDNDLTDFLSKTSSERHLRQNHLSRSNEYGEVCDALGVPYDYFYNAVRASQDSA